VVDPTIAVPGVQPASSSSVMQTPILLIALSPSPRAGPRHAPESPAGEVRGLPRRERRSIVSNSSSVVDWRSSICLPGLSSKAATSSATALSSSGYQPFSYHSTRPAAFGAPPRSGEHWHAHRCSRKFRVDTKSFSCHTKECRSGNGVQHKNWRSWPSPSSRPTPLR
jgi:hypothetical protein